MGIDFLKATVAVRSRLLKLGDDPVDSVLLDARTASWSPTIGPAARWFGHGSAVRTMVRGSAFIVETSQFE
jgi:hypothetical protein